MISSFSKMPEDLMLTSILLRYCLRRFVLSVVVVKVPELFVVSALKAEEYIFTLAPILSLSFTFLDIPACNTPEKSPLKAQLRE